jgi:hypothetical protein
VDSEDALAFLYGRQHGGRTYRRRRKSMRKRRTYRR